MKKHLALLLVIIFFSCKEDPVYYTLTLSSTPTEGGTTNPENGGEYEMNTEISLQANPNSNFEFDKWSGSTTSSSNPLLVTMDSDKNFIANFKLKDSDGDGVSDINDQCADTPQGASVNSNGCADTQLDSDGDGVNDAEDQCPDTPQNTNVNSAGCADSDGDGVSDINDQCADTPQGASVNSNGCIIPPTLDSVLINNYSTSISNVNGLKTATFGFTFKNNYFLPITFDEIRVYVNENSNPSIIYNSGDVFGEYGPYELKSFNLGPITYSSFVQIDFHWSYGDLSFTYVFSKE